ncbi:hypothetical protein IMZ48_19025 [Candidatus Bathyarchaeota archaeon]|nr:hypothetical protein [Candidatus Bathyarchaeota archaeon]
MKAAHAQEPRDVDAIRGRLSGRMTETMDKYQTAVSDIEREVVGLPPTQFPLHGFSWLLTPLSSTQRLS